MVLIVEKKNAERAEKIWFLYLQECAKILEKNNKKINSMTRIILEKEANSLDRETKEFFLECALRDIEIRILQYKKTAEAYFESEKIPTELLEDKNFFVEKNKLYGCDIQKEYKKIKKKIKYSVNFADDNLVVQDLLRKFFAWPCLCIIKNKTEENLPYYVVAKAIRKIFDIKYKK